MNDDDSPKLSATYQIGQPLDDLSVEEITVTIEILKEEIGRLESARSDKSTHLSAADALFSRKS